MKRRRVVFAPEARDDLFELYDWIAATAGSVVAMSYVERIEAYCLGFDVVSERGHRRDDVRPLAHRRIRAASDDCICRG